MTTPGSEACTGSVLFTDLVGFTEFNDAVGDAQAVEVLDRQTLLAAEALNGQDDARLVKELGDGLMLWFGTANAAVDAALHLMGSVESARQHGAFPLAIRMGVHHGEALTRGDDVVGATINIGARVADLAGPGELLVSDVALNAMETEDRDVLHCASVGPVRVKGVREPVWLQRVSR
ncbi:MAG: adenylate/guanylate cyclase domain-containing protein [Ilumatobacter sp.]|uniref:adenylate/guanylate cyclase domain-containing protein n=1 Tax=Ilumatobacter sp. TaxID=1967498 RepID=UPI003753A996|nr:adenylate/guanylate cyclase domain-containing protein [Ilumatobacter sp.]